MLRPDIGYVQGMSYVAGSILLHSEGNEQNAFRGFANLMNRDHLFTFYSFDMEKVNIVFHVFMTLMKERLPKLHGAFKQTNVSCSIFLFEWIVAVYSNIFSLETSARLWDSYLYHGDYYLVRIAIAICACLEASVQGGGTGQFEMMVLLFKNVRNFVTEEALFQALDGTAAGKVTQEEFDRIKKVVEA